MLIIVLPLTFFFFFFFFLNEMLIIVLLLTLLRINIIKEYDLYIFQNEIFYLVKILINFYFMIY